MDKKDFFTKLIDEKNEPALSSKGLKEIDEEKSEEKPKENKAKKIKIDNTNDSPQIKKAEEGQLPVDIYQTPSEIVIKSAIAGVSEKDLDITITNDLVEIRGSRESEKEVSEENYFYSECFWGNFSRSIILPVEVETNKTTASFKNGILTIRLPKSERTKTKKINIKPE